MATFLTKLPVCIICFTFFLPQSISSSQQQKCIQVNARQNDQEDDICDCPPKYIAAKCHEYRFDTENGRRREYVCASSHFDSDYIKKMESHAEKMCFCDRKHRSNSVREFCKIIPMCSSTSGTHISPKLPLTTNSTDSDCKCLRHYNGKNCHSICGEHGHLHDNQSEHHKPCHCDHNYFGKFCEKVHDSMEISSLKIPAYVLLIFFIIYILAPHVCGLYICIDGVLARRAAGQDDPDSRQSFWNPLSCIFLYFSSFVLLQKPTDDSGELYLFASFNRASDSAKITIEPEPEAASTSTSTASGSKPPDYDDTFEPDTVSLEAPPPTYDQALSNSNAITST